MLSKVCERATLGCAGLVTGRWPRDLRRHRFCSRRCAALARIAALPKEARGPQLTPAQRSEAGRAGGTAGAQLRRAKALQRIVQDLGRLLPRDVLVQLAPRDRARIKVLMARAWECGYDRGYRYGFSRSERVTRSHSLGLLEDRVRVKGKRVAA